MKILGSYFHRVLLHRSQPKQRRCHEATNDGTKLSNKNRREQNVFQFFQPFCSLFSQFCFSCFACISLFLFSIFHFIPRFVFVWKQNASNLPYYSVTVFVAYFSSKALYSLRWTVYYFHKCNNILSRNEYSQRLKCNASLKCMRNGRELFAGWNVTGSFDIKINRARERAKERERHTHYIVLLMQRSTHFIFI